MPETTAGAKSLSLWKEAANMPLVLQIALGIGLMKEKVRISWHSLV